MENIISKELLSEVIDFVNPIDEVGNINAFDNTFYVTFKNQCGKNINIYELAHKCKEWAWDNGYEIEELCHNLIVHYLDVEQLEYLKKEFNTEDGLYIPYNPYRVFKACQWILDNKDR